MIDLTFINHYAQVWVALIAFILVFAGLKKLKIYDNNWALAVLSLIIACILASSEQSVNFIFNTIPFLTVLMTISFVILIVLVFVAKDLETFKKPLAIIGFVLCILIVLCMAFNSFPTLNHMLPSSSNAGLTHEAKNFKSWIYSSDFKDGFVFVICIGFVAFLLLKK